MLTIIHGDDTQLSYKELTRLKETFVGKELRELDGKRLTPTDLVEALESSSLFGKDVCVLIQRFLSSVNKKTALYSELFTIIHQSMERADIILYETKEIDKTTLSKFGTDVTVQSFMIPRIIFEFLDGLHKGNMKASLTKLRTIVSHEPVEIVFSMIVKRFRLLIQLSDGITPEGLAPWQAARLTRQARFFTIVELVNLYKDLAKIEIALKTGQSPFTLSQHIEQFIIAIEARV